MTTAELTFFYVRVPDHMPLEETLARADGTVQIAGGFFTAPGGKYVPQEDGTYEVQALAPSYTQMVRELLVEHEGLVIDHEQVRRADPAVLLVEINDI